ncbi:MAG: hypothetical protein QG555_196, partial [Thermodesulfobacteriota bacterium]|nr:hypothetical protein [Thermodesulfobacteriota bacterium]
LEPSIKYESVFGLTRKTFSSLISLFLICLFLFIPVSAPAGVLEIRVGKDTLQSFIAAAFPLTIQQEIVILGAVKVPVAVTLSNPGKLRFDIKGKTPSTRP